jgi:uncharacterized protein YerC
MTQISKHFMSPEISKKVYKVFIDSLKSTKSTSDVINFLDDLLTPTEKIMLAKRVAIAHLLMENDFTYGYITRTLKVSKGTISRVHTKLILQGTGYKKTLGMLLRKKALKIVIAEMLEGFTPFPPKGKDWAAWKRDRYSTQRKREAPL